jgi:hypothetical protein
MTTGRAKIVRWPRIAVIGALLGLAVPAHAVDEKPAALFGIVVGHNGAGSSGLEPLKYADDDAAQSFLLLKELGASAVLLTTFDRASRDLFPALARLASPPSQANLVAALGQINALADGARRQGRRTVLYFFYSGHGDVEGGEGYVHLQDRRLTRAEMLQLLRRSRADSNHVVVDACKSFFLVFSRGPGGRRRPASGHFLPGAPGVPPNTGFFLSSASSRDSHEWEAVQGGVFSHEMRSALRGAADLDGDGLVSYEEASAFIYTANRAIPNPRFRPEFFSQPQRDRPANQAVLADLRSVRGRRVVFGPKMSRHYYVENDRGLRLADLHPHQGSVTLLVPGGEALFVREVGGGRRELALAPASGLVARLQGLPSRPVTAAARGAEHEAFRRLFASAFDGTMLADYRSQPCPEELSPTARRRTAGDYLRPALAGLALAALATGGLFTGLAARERAHVDASTSHLQRQAVNRTIDRYNAVAVTGYVAGSAAAAGFLVWTFWPQREAQVRVSLVPALGGGHVRTDF